MPIPNENNVVDLIYSFPPLPPLQWGKSNRSFRHRLGQIWRSCGGLGVYLGQIWRSCGGLGVYRHTLIDFKPTEIYLSHHARGSASRWGEKMDHNKPYLYQNQQYLVQIHNHQPFVFCVLGSHGFGGSVGDHTYEEIVGIAC
jgi:hypothetical protein